MVLYGITPVPMEEEIQSAEMGIIPPFYADNAAFNGSLHRSAQLLKLLMERGPDRGYFPKPAKSIFMADLPDQEEATNQ